MEDRRLIFFSGGVESTALLTLSKPDDIIVTLIDTPGNIVNFFGDVEIEKNLGVGTGSNKLQIYYDGYVNVFNATNNNDFEFIPKKFFFHT